MLKQKNIATFGGWFMRRRIPLLLGVCFCSNLFLIVRLSDQFQMSTVLLSILLQTTPSQHHEDGELWEIGNESNCFVLDNVCSWNDGWFYGPPPDTLLDDNTTHLNQPSVKLILGGDLLSAHGWHDPGNLQIDSRIRLDTSSSSSRGHYYDPHMCSFSPTPNHMVVQSFYNNMKGSFMPGHCLAYSNCCVHIHLIPMMIFKLTFTLLMNVGSC